MHSDLLSSLAEIKFLANQGEESLKELAEKIKEIKFKKKSVIIHEGDESSTLYFIISGKVKIFCTDENNKHVILALQEAGTSFGVLSLLSDVPRSATVEAIETTICGTISKLDFIQWIHAHPEVAIELMIDLTEKIRNLTEKVKQLALSNAYERTIKVLYELAKTENNIMVIRNKPTQESLATMVGTSRESICKFLNALRDGGYLEISGKTIRILKKLPPKF